MRGIADSAFLLGGGRQWAMESGNKKAQHRCWAFLSLIYKVILVGVRGFELPASMSRTKIVTFLLLSIEFNTLKINDLCFSSDSWVFRCMVAKTKKVVSI